MVKICGWVKSCLENFEEYGLRAPSEMLKAALAKANGDFVMGQTVLAGMVSPLSLPEVYHHLSPTG